MSKKVILGIVIGILVLVVGVIAGLKISREEKIPDVVELEEYVDSILSWETIITKVPKLEGYEVKEWINVRGEEGEIIITPDSPVLWSSRREISESSTNIPGGFRDFSVWIGFFESEAALEEQIKAGPFKVQREVEVTTGFLEEKEPFWDGRERNLLVVLVAKGRLWVQFTAITYFEDSEGEPLATKAELEELISLVKERLLELE